MFKLSTFGSKGEVECSVHFEMEHDLDVNINNTIKEFDTSFNTNLSGEILTVSISINVNLNGET